MQFRPSKLPRFMLLGSSARLRRREPSSSRDLPETILVDSQRPHLRFQRRSRYSQLAWSPCGSRNAPTGIFQGTINHVLLLHEESPRELNLLFRLWCQHRPLGQPAFVDRENLRFAKDHRTLDDVLQFANVSRPRIGLKQFQRLLVDTFYVLASFSRVAIDEVFHQQGNVLSSLSKRGHLDREYIQPIKQITTKGPSADGGLQVTIGGCNHPYVSANSTSAADTLKLVLLQNTQECNLSLNWKLSDFVEENRASICEFKPTRALLSRAREGALLMAEQLRSDQIAGDCRTVHTNESTRSTI